MFDIEGSRGEFLRLLVEMGEEPAFVGRARAPELALRSLLIRCQTYRDELLLWPRRHFHVLRKLVAGKWWRLDSFVSDSDPRERFVKLSEQLPPLETDFSPSFFLTHRSALKAFVESAKRFNSTWTDFLASDVLDEVNERRTEFNRYYKIERECAMGNAALGLKFAPLPVLDPQYLETRFPLLDVPTIG
ncbi:hypothetical protein [Roseiconus lacunae]|uniref:Uncharacterized protein n=1 Tax=Roseiconus lacunae TaxID=2605694 RepID=A0ABT7PNL1_9BACT|nr:hypothetical protein [Roseiconus lacunae]MDM4018102.1 hypothetical protein [Roseiconus lacunae]